jgi:peroxiredoxin
LLAARCAFARAARLWDSLMQRSVKGTPTLFRPGNLFALAAFAATALGAAQAAGALAGSEAPDFVLKSTSGENLRLSEYRGEVVMLAFWATWCGECRAQLAALGEMHTRYGDTGVELLAVSLDQSLRQAVDGAKTLGASYPVLHDAGGAIGELYAVDRMPMFVLIDRAGIVRDVFEGHRRGNEDEYLKRVQALLRE